MNILQAEDLVKGMPDQALIQQAKAPGGQIPQYLLVSEVQRRTDMRKRFEAQQQQPQGTIAEQVLGGGIGSLHSPQGGPQPPIPKTPGAPPGMGMAGPPPAPQGQPGMPQQGPPQGPPPQGMARGGIVNLSRGGPVRRMQSGGGVMPPFITLPVGPGTMGRFSTEGFRTIDEVLEAAQNRKIWPTEVFQGNDTVSYDPRSGQMASQLGMNTVYENPALSMSAEYNYGGNSQGREMAPSVGKSQGESGVDWGGIGLSVKDAAGKLASEIVPSGAIAEGIKSLPASGAKDMYGAVSRALYPEETWDQLFGAGEKYLAGAKQPWNVIENTKNAWGVASPVVSGVWNSMKDSASKAGAVGKEMGRGLLSEVGFDVGSGPFVRGIHNDPNRGFIDELKDMTALMNGEQQTQNVAASSTGAASSTKPATPRNVSGQSPIQTQAMGPPAPEGYGAGGEEGGGEGGLDAMLGAMLAGGEGGQPAESEYIKRLMALLDEKSPDVPDMSDLVEQQRRDAYGAALAQLGAGIAAGDTAGGLSKAGAVAYQGRGDARDLEMQQRLLQYQNQRGEQQRQADILSTAGQLDIRQQQYGAYGSRQTAALMREIYKQTQMNQRNIIDSATQMWKEMMAVRQEEFYDLTPEQRGQKEQELFMSALTLVAGKYIPNLQEKLAAADGQGGNKIVSALDLRRR